MSFGKLNILQHKSWNVWNRDNIEKVLRDEREHKEKEGEEHRRRGEVESESRTQLLRKRKQEERSAGGGDDQVVPHARPRSVRFEAGDDDDDDNHGDDAGAGEEHRRRGQQQVATVGEGGGEGEGGSYKGFNLFEGKCLPLEANASATASGKSVEREAEKEKEREKEQRQWGLVGLGQDSFSGESYGARPWYAAAEVESGAAQQRVQHGSGPFGISQGDGDRRRRDEKRKHSDDPMASIEKHLKEKKRAKEHKKEKKHKKKSHRDEGGGHRVKTDEEKAEMMQKLRLAKANNPLFFCPPLCEHMHLSLFLFFCSTARMQPRGAL
jgi:hypothetical protein